MKWWLFPKQVDPEQDKFPGFSVFIIFVSVIGVCTFFRAITWPANKHVDIEFAVQAIIMPLTLLVTLLELFLLALNGFRHYSETRLLIADTQEYKLKTYARLHLILAGWSALTPLEEPALNMLKLEGEFPLVPKTPLKIPLADEFDYTRNEQVFCRLLEPMVSKLNHPGYRHVETVVWVKGGDESCIDELRRTLARLGVTIEKISFLSECPDYTLINEWLDKAGYLNVVRLLICVDLHGEGDESKSMENATALLLSNGYASMEGEKPVYLYQPMIGMNDVETAMPVYLQMEPVSKPKILWYTGLSKVQKYPLMQALDEQKQASDRLCLEDSLGVASRGYRWLALALAADAVKYAQGDQFVAMSEKNQFAITALSSRLTCLPEEPRERYYSLPYNNGGTAGIMCSIFILLVISETIQTEMSSLSWYLLLMVLLPLVIFIGLGVFVTYFMENKAHEHMWGY
ncbi:hypothetical protein PUZ93_003949 [Cronobacter turicensis]|nr:hypothetical protein [Cronobacter turicensis]